MTEAEWNNCTDRIKMLSFLFSRKDRAQRRRSEFPYYWEDGSTHAPEMRKMRLFVCACVGREAARLPDDRSRQAIAVAERFADGRASLAELDAAWTAAQAAAQDAQSLVEAASMDSEHAAASAESAFKTALRSELAAENALEVAEHCWSKTGASQDFDQRWAAAVDADGRHQSARALAASVQKEADAAEEAYYLALKRLDAAWDAAWAANRRICRAACVVDGSGVRREDLVRELWGNPFRPPVVARSWLSWNDGVVVRLAEAIYEEHAFERMPLLADALLDAGCTDEALLAHCREPRPHARGCWVLDALLGKQ